MMKTPLTEYWKLLDSMEDYFKYGIRRNHPAPPVFGGAPSGSQESYSASNTPDSLECIEGEVCDCTKCGLSSVRNKTVPGTGKSEQPIVMVIGEAPGGDEDQTGIPFVGKAGQYLDKWLDSVGLSRNTNCFIGNIIKCRPPANRDPEPGEISACLPFLDRQIALIQPAIILSVGRIASQVLTGQTDGIGQLRGKSYCYNGIPLIPTYHPSGVLRNPEYRGKVWEDLKRLKELMESLEG